MAYKLTFFFNACNRSASRFVAEALRRQPPYENIRTN